MSKKEVKTNAMRILDRLKISYEYTTCLLYTSDAADE